VDGLHVQGVAQYEGDVMLGAQVGQPVPGEHALGGHDDALLPIRRKRIEKQVPPSGQVAMHEDRAGLIDDAHVHALGVQIDAAIEWVLSLVESHRGPPE